MVGIKSMEMPETCFACGLLCDGYKGVSRCYVTDEALIENQIAKKRSDKCPLVELEEKDED